MSKISNRKLAEEIKLMIKVAEEAASIHDLRNIKKITGYKFHYRIRVGDYRIGIYFNGNILEFAAFDHRKDIYKYFP